MYVYLYNYPINTYAQQMHSKNSCGKEWLQFLFQTLAYLEASSQRSGSVDMSNIRKQIFLTFWA